MADNSPEQVSVDNEGLEPVVFCPKCYSLKIVHEENLDVDCCMDCGCTETQEAPFEVWEHLYEKRYGKKFAVKNTDFRKSPICLLPLNKLMEKVSHNTQWKTIITTIYSNFPKHLDKANAVILFFDKLVKDNRLDALRELLYKMKLY